MSATSNWKNNEYRLRDLYRKFGFEAERKSRAGNFAESTYDIEVFLPSGTPFEVRNDGKHTKAKPFRHHGLLEEIRAKYCSKKSEIPILFTHNYKERGGVIAVDDEILVGLLAYFTGVMPKQEILELWGIK